MISSTGFASRLAGFTVAFSGLLAVQSAAADVRVDTSAIDAVSTMQFSYDAFAASDAANIVFGAAGYASRGPGMTNEAGDFAPSFYLPINSIVLSPTLFNLTNVGSGDATGSALTFTRFNNARDKVISNFVLANFTVDYKASQVTSDFIFQGASRRLVVYNFERKESLTPRFDNSGALLGLQLHEVLGNLKLSQDASDSFAAALRLSKTIQAGLEVIDFGTLTQDINIGIRQPVPVRSFTTADAAMVPEASSYATMAIGLVGMGMLMRKRRKQQG